MGDYVVSQSCSADESEHYLDDFLFGSKAGTYECTQIMAAFFATCAKMGVPIGDEQTEGSQTVIVFLGLECRSQHVVSFESASLFHHSTSTYPCFIRFP